MFFTIIGDGKDDFKSLMANWGDFDFAVCGSDGGWMVTVESESRKDIIEQVENCALDNTVVVYQYQMDNHNVLVPGNMFFAPFSVVKGFDD